MEDIIVNHSANGSNNSSHISMCDTTKLPTIQLLMFDGNLEDWASFIDTFNALFHNNNSLNEVKWLHDIKSNVTGPVEDIIKNFPITSENR